MWVLFSFIQLSPLCLRSTKLPVYTVPIVMGWGARLKAKVSTTNNYINSVSNEAHTAYPSYSIMSKLQNHKKSFQLKCS